MSPHGSDDHLLTTLRASAFAAARSLRCLRLAAPVLVTLGAAFPAAATGILPDEQALVLQYAALSSPPFGGGAALVAGDIDNDGDVDVVCADSNNATVRVVFNDRGHFTQQAYVFGLAPSALALADLDADGDLDLVVGLETGLRMLLNDGTGSLSAQPLVAFQPGDTSPVALAVLDLDADGQLDLLVGLSHHALPSGSWTGGLLAAHGDGGAFQLGPVHALALPAHRMVIADFNGDLLPDAAELGGYVSASAVNLAFGVAAGGFVNGPSTSAAGLYASGFAAGDWDGDGDIDLATGNKYDVRLLMNDGVGQFTIGQLIGVGNYVKGLAAGDLDRDGDVDLLATSGSSSAMRLLGNDGHGVFVTLASLPATSQASAVLLADTSGDGYLDPWAGDVVSGTLSIGASQCLAARYGTGKADSLGCVPAMAVTGKPSLAAPGFVVRATGEPASQPALVLFGFGPAALPALGGTLLVQSPWIAIATTTSAGSGDPAACDAVVSIPIGTPALAAAGVGTRVFVQVLAKDSVLAGAAHVSMTDGLWFEVAP